MPQRPAIGVIYVFILAVLSTLVSLFFREIQVRGERRVPSGPVILVAGPHANQFIDSVILMRILRSLDRRISWLMAAKSFDRPLVGGLATAMGALPVQRAMDLAKEGEGRIYLPDPVNKPLQLRGIGTDFTASLSNGRCSLYLPTINGESHRLDVAEIQGPGSLSLKSPVVHPDAIFQLTGMTTPNTSDFQGSKYKIVPRLDQSKVYNAVHHCLEDGGCVGIFPEGGSHDRTKLLPLKGN